MVVHLSMSAASDCRPRLCAIRPGHPAILRPDSVPWRPKRRGALLEARRKLLAQRNPLGLAYRLYANADLHLAPAAAVHAGPVL
jgi:hypothetical protein